MVRRTMAENKRTISQNEFINLSSEVHNGKYDYSLVRYTRKRDKVTIICPIHGEFNQYPFHHLNGNGCKQCGIAARATKQRLSTEEIIKRKQEKEQKKLQIPIRFLNKWKEKAAKIHNNKYNYDLVTWINANTNIEIVCPEHGSFWQRPHNHICHKNGCPMCQYSISNKELEWLDSLNIPRDWRQICIIVNEKKFFADGYDNESNTIYLFHGDYWHGNPKKYNPLKINPHTKKSFGKLYEETLHNEKILKDAGYNIISMWEFDYDKIAQELLNE